MNIKNDQKYNTISIPELVNTFWHNKNYAFIIFLISLLIGFVIAIMKPNKYEYMQPITIANYIENKSEIYYPSSNSKVIAVLNDLIIPKVLSSYTQKDPKNLNFIKIKATEISSGNPIGGAIQITDAFPPKYKNAFALIVNEIGNRYFAYEAQSLQLVKNRLQKELDLNSFKIDSTRARINLFRLQLTAIEKQYSEVNAYFLKNSDQLEKGDKIVPEHSAADGFKIEYQGSEIVQFKSLLYEKLSPLIQDLQTKILVLNMEQEDLKRRHAILQEEINTLVRTKFDGPIVTSILPIQADRKKILLLSLMFGLIFGIGGALFAGYVKSITLQRS